MTQITLFQQAAGGDYIQSWDSGAQQRDRELKVLWELVKLVD